MRTFRTSKLPKYRNHKVTVDGEKFDSMKEYRRYEELKLMQKAKLISGLKRQVAFILIPAVTLHGRKKPAIKYIADYAYFIDRPESLTMVVEDVKSEITKVDPVFRLKLHLMKHIHNIEVIEV